MKTVAPIRVQVSHGDPIFAAGLEAILSQQPDMLVLSTNAPPQPGAASIASPSTSAPVVHVADYASGVELARAQQRREQGPFSQPARVLVISGQAKEWDVRAALAAGVHGYLVQGGGIHELLDAVRGVAQGLRYMGREVSDVLADSLTNASLTSRERDVLSLLAVGYCNKQISNELDLAVGTVKTHMKAVFSKLGVGNRTKAIVVAAQRGIVPAPEWQPVRAAAARRPMTESSRLMA
ncbi:DNA-binding response regulator, NarL/FixJ family, contains REC and HTH domains [Roseateles sp. YR242]|uniref:response regulator transcription factor n=1 Tax=Roseateles sp. YR242 TaxID=1855305 RepID=UPI0008AB8E3F|nr:response regulator transcription factor [Roseateles sp. YR242]SEL17112.1 DNA-binding response regulator, NarL/FixJ family, contains REC and HTH domains [Roseateles sp. YR242]